MCTRSHTICLMQAQLSLERKGLHAVKRCRLPSLCPNSLLDAPGRVFGGLVACDVMHTIFINWSSYFLNDVHGLLTASMKEKLDQRMEMLWGRFRNPQTGETSRAPKEAITSQVGLTAELRVLAVFLMMHVLGSQGSIFNTDIHKRVREHVLIAGSSLILVLTAVRNKRPYTEMEWDEIFGPVSLRFFRALDSIKHFGDHRKFNETRDYNLKHPDKPPKQFKRFVCEEREPLDSSDGNSTDDEARSLVGFYDRRGYILPHAAVHMKSQVPESVYLGTLT